jgi:hypothetical protein
VGVVNETAVRLHEDSSVNQLRASAKGLAMNCNVLSNRNSRRVIPAACAAALALACAVSLPAHAGRVETPDVPDTLKVDDGNHPFLVGHAIGTQNYVCAPAGLDAQGQPRFAYTLFTPEATLFNDDGDQLITHYFSPNQDQRPPGDPNTDLKVQADGAIRATWQHSRDGSTVWAKVKATVPVSGTIALVLLDVVGHEDGLTGGDFLSKTKQIQRLNTTGGVPRPEGCTSSADVGHTAFADYTADYYFYTNE